MCFEITRSNYKILYFWSLLSTPSSPYTSYHPHGLNLEQLMNIKTRDFIQLSVYTPGEKSGEKSEGKEGEKE